MKKPKKPDIKPFQVEFGVGDPDCLHCEILDAIGNFAQNHRGGVLYNDEIIEGIINVLIEFITDKRLSDDDKIHIQDDILEQLSRSKIDWMRVTGGKQ